MRESELWHVSKQYIWDGTKYVGLPGITYENPDRTRTTKGLQLRTHNGVEKNRKRKIRVRHHD